MGGPTSNIVKPKKILSPEDTARKQFGKARINNELKEVLLSSYEFKASLKDSNHNRYLVEKVTKNIVLLRANKIRTSDITHAQHPYISLLFSSHLDSGLHIAYALDVTDAMVLVDIVKWIGIECKGSFHESLFDECLEHFGKEKLHEIFTCGDQAPFLADGTDLNRPVIHSESYMNLAQERNKLISFCSQYMKSGQRFMLHHFLANVEPSEGDDREICYLGSYASEIRYFIEKLGISFDKLFALEPNVIASYCGLFRSLCNATYYKELGIEMYLEFLVGRKPCELEPKEIFTRDSMSHFLMHRGSGFTIDPHSLKRLEEFVDFLRQHTSRKYPQLSENNMKYMVSTVKKDQEIKRLKREAEEVIRKKQEALLAKKNMRPGRNYQIISALAANLESDSPLHTLLLGDSYSNLHIPKGNFLNIYNQTLQTLDRKYAGLYSIGGKIHFPESIPQEKLDAFNNTYGFKNTSFKMIHANTSLLLPPSNFPEELIFMISCMSESGLFGNDPQLQISIPGRLPNKLGAVLGSSMILLSNEHVQYSKESFGTTHNSETGRRMVTYDAGVYDPNFKYNTENIIGRTDVLMLKDMNLIPKAKVIGSLLSQTIYDGRFADLGLEFIRDYAELLVKYNMEGILDGPWIYEPTVDMEKTLDPHFSMVKALTDKHEMDWLIYNHTKHNQGLMVFELKKLLTTYWKRIESLQQRFINNK